MATVQELVTAFVATTGAPASRVRAVARKLLDQGVLPRSAGRRLAQVDLSHAAVLVFSYYATETATVSEAARAADYLTRDRAGLSLAEVVSVMEGGKVGLIVDASTTHVYAWAAALPPELYPYPRRIVLIPASVLADLCKAVAAPSPLSLRRKHGEAA